MVLKLMIYKINQPTVNGLFEYVTRERNDCVNVF